MNMNKMSKKDRQKVYEFKKYQEEYLREQDFGKITQNKEFMTKLNNVLSKKEIFNS